ncbi:MAG: GNAT family N-acetyltransferase [Thermoleophilaceae bacterium]|nr:GNAT family N-acetyltransferase [Thermoleophilaceae bacterium]
MPSRFFELPEIDAQSEQAWRRLAERSVDANPFFEPNFVIPAARHLGGRSAGLLVLEEGGEWLACLPVTGRGVWRTPYTFLGTPLVAPGAEAALPGLLLEGRRGTIAGAAMLDQLPRASAAWRTLEDAIARGDLVPLLEREFDRAAFVPNGRGPELPLPSRRRADLRRTRRRLEERLGGDVVYAPSPPDDETIARFLELEAGGWKGEAGTALASRESHAEFFAEMCRRFGRAGRIEIVSMSCAGRVVAMATMLRSGDCRYAFKIAIDEEFRKQAPGAQLIVELAEHPPEGAAAFMDSCSAPDNETMNRLWPDRRELVTVVLARPGVRAGVMKRALRVAGAVRAGEAA